MSGRYVLTIEPVRAARWAHVCETARLRRLLKATKRQFGYRCVECRRAP